MSALDLAAQELALLQTADLQECADNPTTFIERHCTIETPKGEIIPFEFWPFQRQTCETLHNERLVIVLKARRLGLSWLALSYALWLAIFQQGTRILILCKTEPDAAELLDRIRRMRDRIAADPSSTHLLAGLPKPNKIRDAVKTLDIGSSTIKALVGTESAARSETAGYIIADEFAFQRNAALIWRAMGPTIEGGGKLVVISTGNGSHGDGAEFHRVWTDATTGKSDFVPLFWPWDVRPTRSQEWKSQMIQQLGGLDRFQVEYPEHPDEAFQMPDATLVYSPQGINAAELLGREYGELQEQNELVPLNDATNLGIDWGEKTHALPGWELEAGGIYIPPQEIVESGTEPAESTAHILDMVEATGYPLGVARYDAAGIQSMRTFTANAPANTRTLKISFGKYKQETIDYLRLLFNRAEQGYTTRIIAIHPSNTELLRQLRALKFKDSKDADQGKIDKGDDHGPDALIALVAPIAARNRKIIEDHINKLDEEKTPA